MSRFFIDRPIFAWVIAIAIMLGGLLALRTLPIAQYPEIAPPTVHRMPMKATKERSAFRRSMAKSTTGSVERRLAAAVRDSGVAGSLRGRPSR